VKKEQYIFVAHDFISFEKFKIDLVLNVKKRKDVIIYLKSNKTNKDKFRKLSNKLKKIQIFFYSNNFNLMKSLKKYKDKEENKIFINFFNHGLIISFYNIFFRLNNLYLFCEGRGRFFPTIGFSLEKISIINFIVKNMIISNYKKIIVCNKEDFLFFNSNKVLNLGPIGINKLEYDKKYKKNNYRIQIFFIGRFLKSKGADIYLKIFESLSNHKNVNFFMIGQFDRLNIKIKKKISKLNSFQNFQLVNYVDNLPSYFNKRSLLVFPSYYGEGSPRIIQECLNLKVPVIAFNTRGVNELIENFINGIIIKNYDFNLIQFYIKKFIVDPKFLKNINTSDKTLNLIDIDNYIKKFNKYLLTND
jgi:glycosyltransferase involved in cell wall biosynthesis